MFVAVSEILYFSASPPYISICMADKKYLYTDTLKSLSGKLNPAQFIRVHKSTIINIAMVESFTSRLNGDYDLTMKNKATIRVSRHYAADFKIYFAKMHRVTVK
jgi:DNA-binding LytR/AlgR family response regulator